MDEEKCITIKAMITSIKHDVPSWYDGCSTPRCNKKLVQDETKGTSSWYCGKCQKEIPQVSFQHILSTYH
jgi:hypothetical protein